MLYRLDATSFCLYLSRKLFKRIIWLVKKLVPVGKDSPVENLCFFYCSFFHTPLLFKIRTEFYRIVLRYIQLTTPRFFSHFHFYIILKCFFFSYYYSTPYFFILGFIFAFPFFSRIIIIFFLVLLTLFTRCSDRNQKLGPFLFSNPSSVMLDH